MKEINDIAAKYAVGKANDAIDKAIAQSYADGYRDGYKDREEEIPVDLRDNKTVFIDLGLPSGTLWSLDFEKNSNEFIYAPYESTTILEIPTLEQCSELFSNCKFSKKDGLIYCIGPNGKYIKFALAGYKEIANEPATYTVASVFWINNCNEKADNTARILNMRGLEKDTYKEFSGNKLPIRLVRKSNR